MVQCCNETLTNGDSLVCTVRVSKAAGESTCWIEMKSSQTRDSLGALVLIRRSWWAKFVVNRKIRVGERLAMAPRKVCLSRKFF